MSQKRRTSAPPQGSGEKQYHAKEEEAGSNPEREEEEEKTAPPTRERISAKSPVSKTRRRGKPIQAQNFWLVLNMLFYFGVK